MRTVFHWLLTIAILAGAVLAMAHYWSVFIVPPIPALPVGATLVVWRVADKPLIDSADAWCKRMSVNSSVQCRTLAFAAAKSGGIFLDLPYSGLLDRLASQR
jgi:hypothetical protein